MSMMRRLCVSTITCDNAAFKGPEGQQREKFGLGFGYC